MSPLSVYPISSTACERGFSQMNLQQTSLRNSLQVETLSSLLMISVNGPPLEHWSPRRYVLSWLKTGHRSTLDKLSGIARKPRELKSSHKLFLWLYTDIATLAATIWLYNVDRITDCLLSQNVFNTVEIIYAYAVFIAVIIYWTYTKWWQLVVCFLLSHVQSSPPSTTIQIQILVIKATQVRE